MDSRLEGITSLCASVDQSLSDQAQQITALQQQVTNLQQQAAQPKAVSAIRIAAIEELQSLSGTTEATGWIQPGNAGDTGGASSKPNGKFIWSPGNPLDVAIVSAAGAYPYNNGYWYTKVAKDISTAQVQAFMLSFVVSFPSSSDRQACNGLEFEIQQSLNGNIYDMAWQILQPATNGELRTFDKINRKWVGTGVKLPVTTWLTPVPITAIFSRNVNSFDYTGIEIAGKQYLTAPITTPAWAAKQSDYVSIGFQLDSNGKTPPTPYKVYVENMRIIYTF